MRHDLFSKRLLLGPFVAISGFAVAANTFPSLLTTVTNEFNESISDFGYIFSLQYFFYAIASFSGGWLMTRLSLGINALIGVGILSLVFSFFIASYFPVMYFFLIWAAPFGFAGGLVETFSSVAISSRSSDKSSKMLTLSQVFYCLGAFSSPYVISCLLASGWNWRHIVLALGGLLAAVYVIFVLLSRKCKHDVVPCHVAAETLKPEKPGQVYTLPIFWLSGPLLFMYVVVELTVVCWLPAYFELHYKVSAASAAWRPVLLWSGYILGRVLILALPSKWTLFPAIFGSIAGMCIAAVGLFVIDDTVAASLLVLSLGFSAGPFWPAMVMVASHLNNKQEFVSGVIGCGALGAAVAPFLSATAIRLFGIDFLFLYLFFATAALMIPSVALNSVHNTVKKTFCGKPVDYL